MAFENTDTKDEGGFSFFQFDHIYLITFSQTV